MLVTSFGDHWLSLYGWTKKTKNIDISEKYLLVCSTDVEMTD